MLIRDEFRHTGERTVEQIGKRIRRSVRCHGIDVGTADTSAGGSRRASCAEKARWDFISRAPGLQCTNRFRKPWCDDRWNNVH
jgi:hypothetical protein